MKLDVRQELERLNLEHRKKKRWTKLLSGMAAVVVFCTTYALILPAITMTDVECGMEEHIHTQTCYHTYEEKTWMQLKACALEEYIHTQACMQDEACGLIGEVDGIIHTHEDHCYDQKGNLLCTLEEMELHRHSDDCYILYVKEVTVDPADDTAVDTTEPPAQAAAETGETAEDVSEAAGEAAEPDGEMSDELAEPDGETGGMKSDEQESKQVPSAAEPVVETVTVYADEPQCGMEEFALHTHTQNCLDETGALICTELQLIRHQHGEACLESCSTTPDLTELACEVITDRVENLEEPHVHEESCYTYWTLACDMPEHTHTEACSGGYEYTTEVENEGMILTLHLSSKSPIPEDLSAQLRRIERSEEAYAPYASHAMESAPGELRTLSAYEILFFSGGEEIVLPDAEITAELTVKELEIPETEEVAPLENEPAEEPMAQTFSLRSLAPALTSVEDPGEDADNTSEGSLAAGAAEEGIEDDAEAYQMHLTALQSEGGHISNADRATVEPKKESGPVTMLLHLGSARTFALARSVEPLPVFEIHYLCNMLRYYEPDDPELYLKVINTARTDGSYPVAGEPKGGILPVNGKGTGNSPNSNAIYNLPLEISNTHSGYYRTAMTYQLVEVYQQQENVIYSNYDNAMTSRQMNVLRENENYDVIYIQTLPAGETDWSKATVYDVNWDSSTSNIWDNVNLVSSPSYTWKDVDDLYYFTNNPNHGNMEDEDGKKPILITDGMVMRYIYFPTSADESFDAAFFDYDISNGGNTANLNATTKSMNTGRMGINSLSNYRNGSGTAHLAFGNRNTASGWYSQTMARDGYNNVLNQYNSNSYGRGYEGLTFGIVKGYDAESGRLIYNDNVIAPYLFTYDDGEPVIGKTAYDGQMTFRRDGDTYTLTRVQGSGGVYADNLELFQTTYKNSTKHLVSNSFWPFDGINNGGSHDYHFGKYGTTLTCNGMDGNGKSEKATAPVSDAYPESAAVNHNSYFGLEYAVTFHLDGSYTGPLEYLFYGDDDMWVFLTDHQTGETHLIADIGGVHSSVGSYTDLWDWVPNTAERPNGKGDYTLRFFYTERGASGSSCYMQFTIPEAVGMTQQIGDVGSVEVEKSLAGGMTSDEDFRFTYDILYPSGTENAEHDRLLPYTIFDADGVVVSGAMFRKGEFDLKAGERILIGNIPVGSQFAVSEQVTGSSSYEAQWTEVPEGATWSGDTVTGTITTAGQTIPFTCTNTYDSLTLEKLVEVEAGFAVPREFTFEVLFTDADGAPLTGTLNTVVKRVNGSYEAPAEAALVNGKLTVKLEMNETVSFYPLPKGTNYTVTETDGGGLLPTWPDGSGNDVHSDSITGSITSGNVSVTCVNRAYYKMPSTGGVGTTLYTMGGLLLMASATLLGYKSRRKKVSPSS